MVKRDEELGEEEEKQIFKVKKSFKSLVKKKSRLWPIPKAPLAFMSETDWLLACWLAGW